MSTELDAYYSGGPRTWQEAFPPICVKTHWDPTVLTSYVLPPAGLKSELALDPRQSAYICTSYYDASAGDSPLKLESAQPLEIPIALRGGMQRPQRGHGLYYPTGGAASLGFPYSRFSSDTESDILRLGEPLTKCAERRYLPPNGLPAASVGTNTIYGADQSSGLSPALTDVTTLAGCREEDDVVAWNNSSRLFFNTTRYDRTTQVPQGLQKSQAQNAIPFPCNMKK